MNNDAQKLFFVRRPHDLPVAYGHAMPICFTIAPVGLVFAEFLGGGNRGRSVPLSGGPPD
jgi:hypothetical protein